MLTNKNITHMLYDSFKTNYIGCLKCSWKLNSSDKLTRADFVKSGHFTKYGPAYSFVKGEDSREVHFGGVAANKCDLSL